MFEMSSERIYCVVLKFSSETHFMKQHLVKRFIETVHTSSSSSSSFSSSSSSVVLGSIFGPWPPRSWYFETVDLLRGWQTYSQPPSLRAKASLYVRHLTQNMAGMGALPELYFPHNPIERHVLGPRSEM